MGCWNGTCAISHLPINASDEVKLIFIKASPNALEEMAYKSAFCYSNGVFAPAFMPIDAKYNDYGGVEDIKDNIISRVAPISLLAGVNKIKAKERTREVAKLFKDETALEILIESIERGEIEFLTEGDIEDKKMGQKAYELYKDQGLSDKNLKEWKALAEQDISEQWRNPYLSFVMIRKDVWDSIVEKIGDKKTYYNRSAEPYISGKEFYRDIFNDAVSKIRKPFGSTLYYESIFSSGGYAGGQSMANYRIIDEAFKKSIKLKREEEFFTPWFELKLIESFMEGSRRAWMPTTGEGSQYDGFEDHLMLGEIVNNICKEKIKEQEEY